MTITTNFRGAHHMSACRIVAGRILREIEILWCHHSYPIEPDHSNSYQKDNLNVGYSFIPFFFPIWQDEMFVRQTTNFLQLLKKVNFLVFFCLVWLVWVVCRSIQPFLGSFLAKRRLFKSYFDVRVLKKWNSKKINFQL